MNATYLLNELFRSINRVHVILVRLISYSAKIKFRTSSALFRLFSSMSRKKTTHGEQFIFKTDDISFDSNSFYVGISSSSRLYYTITTLSQVCYRKLRI